MADNLQALQGAVDQLIGTVGAMKLTVTIVAAIGIATLAGLATIYSSIGDVKTGVAVMEERLKNQTEAIKSLPAIESKLDALLAAGLPMPQTPPTDDSEK